jgi:hypothetical protein
MTWPRFGGFFHAAAMSDLTPGSLASSVMGRGLIFTHRSDLEARPTSTQGVAPQTRDKSHATLLDREAGGRSPALPLLVGHRDPTMATRQPTEAPRLAACASAV